MSRRGGNVKGRSLRGGQVIQLGLIDGELVRNVRLIGHLGAARVIADVAATFLIRSWLDARIREELASGHYGSDPEMPP